jgi:hypothetical protein
MTLHHLRQPPEPALGAALERFEKQFQYPLGTDASFRISHGRDYLPFFRAIGDSTVIVAERDGEVVGTLAGVWRPLRFPGGEVQIAAYLCDLKVSPCARYGRILLTMARELESQARAAGCTCGYSVVMDGTRQTPLDYTGRCSIPGFSPSGEVVILKMTVPSVLPTIPGIAQVSLAQVDDAFPYLVGTGYIPLGGSPILRSSMKPVPLLASDEAACGVVEDTRRGKRLITETGEELRAAHLSRFGYASAESGAALLRQALTVAAEAGYPALFVCLRRRETAAFRPLLAGLELLEASATVYAHQIGNPDEWTIHSSEI